MTCPRCGGEVFVGVDDRAWCLKRYDAGGCGAFWPSWSRKRLDSRLSRRLDVL